MCLNKIKQSIQAKIAFYCSLIHMERVYGTQQGFRKEEGSHGSLPGADFWQRVDVEAVQSLLLSSQVMQKSAQGFNYIEMGQERECTKKTGRERSTIAQIYFLHAFLPKVGLLFHFSTSFFTFFCKKLPFLPAFLKSGISFS